MITWFVGTKKHQIKEKFSIQSAPIWNRKVFRRKYQLFGRNHTTIEKCFKDQFRPKTYRNCHFRSSNRRFHFFGRIEPFSEYIQLVTFNQKYTKNLYFWSKSSHFPQYRTISIKTHYLPDHQVISTNLVISNIVVVKHFFVVSLKNSNFWKFY